MLGGGIAITTRDAFPADLGTLVLAFRLVFNVAEVIAQPERDVSIELRRRDGRVITRSGGPYNARTELEWAQAHGVGELPLNAVVPLIHLQVDEAAEYDVALTVDGGDVVVLPITVRQVDAEEAG